MKQRFVVWRYAPVLPRTLLRNIAPLPPPFANANSFLFLVHSAGVLPCDSSHRLKSFILTLCSTAGCLTRTFNSVNPSPISSTQMSPRRIPSACATASYSDSAVTSTACSVPTRSRQETRQERRAMRGRLACFAVCSPLVSRRTATSRHYDLTSTWPTQPKLPARRRCQQLSR